MMARIKTQKRKPGQRPWQPLTRQPMNPSYRAAMYPDGIPKDFRVEVWGSDLYSVVAEINTKQGTAYLTIKRHDRHAIRDWRHLQSIKNEVCGPEREAFEIFPAESRLMDTSNQYHLWVVPEGAVISVGQMVRELCSPANIREHNAATNGRGRQRDWQPGLSTGPEVSS